MWCRVCEIISFFWVFFYEIVINTPFECNCRVFDFLYLYLTFRIAEVYFGIKTYLKRIAEQDSVEHY